MLILTETTTYGLRQAAECLLQQEESFRRLLQLPDEIPYGLTVLEHDLLPVEIIDFHKALLQSPEWITQMVAEFTVDPAVPELAIVADLVSPSEVEPLKQILTSVDKESCTDDRVDESDRRIRASWYSNLPNKHVQEIVAPFANIELKPMVLGKRVEVSDKSEQSQEAIDCALCAHACRAANDHDVLRQLVIDMAVRQLSLQREASNE